GEAEEAAVDGLRDEHRADLREPEALFLLEIFLRLDAEGDVLVLEVELETEAAVGLARNPHTGLQSERPTPDVDVVGVPNGHAVDVRRRQTDRERPSDGVIDAEGCAPREQLEGVETNVPPRAG